LTGRIIGVGQEWAGDDGVGIAVIRKLREAGAPIDLVEVVEPTQLIGLLTDGADPVVLVDAVLDEKSAGRVLVFDAGAREPLSERLLSTHGLGVIQAIELARITQPAKVAHRILIVGITIRDAQRRGSGLSEAVAAAVPRAAHEAMKLAEI
jgi:hydrogenase maturation protease